MQIQLDMPTGLEEQLKALILQATKEAMEENKKQMAAKEWMNLKEGAAYAGVSYSTFMKFRAMGLKIAEVDGTIKRVNKKEIDRFMESLEF